MTEAEKRVVTRLEGEGYTVLKRGWPDILALRGTEVRLIEIKAGQDRISFDQLEMHKALAMAGFNVEILKAGPVPGRKRRRRYATGCVTVLRGRHWLGLWWENGRRRSKVLGRVSEMTKAEAARMLDQVMPKEARGG